MTISKLKAAKFLIDRSRFNNKFKNLKEYFEKFHVVQVDPLNVVATNQELVLRNRVENFKRADLQKELYGKSRSLFEHWLQLYSIISLDLYPHLLIERQSTDSHRADFAKKHKKEIKMALDFISSFEGSAHTKDLKHIPAVSNFMGWKDKKSQKAILDYLWDAGKLTISHREGNHKLYDLTENLIPAETLNKKTSRETSLKILIKSYFDYFGIIQKSTLSRFRRDLRSDIRKYFAELVESNEVAEIAIEGSSSKYFIWNQNCDDLMNSNELSSVSDNEEVRFVAPLDPIVWDRQLLLDVFDFYYRWEVYTPPAKRTVGYYNLPILRKNIFIGQIALRKNKKGILQTENIVLNPDYDIYEIQMKISLEIQKLQNFIST